MDDKEWAEGYMELGRQEALYEMRKKALARDVVNLMKEGSLSLKTIGTITEINQEDLLEIAWEKGLFRERDFCVMNLMKWMEGAELQGYITALDELKHFIPKHLEDKIDDIVESKKNTDVAVKKADQPSNYLRKLLLDFIATHKEKTYE